MTNKLIRKKPNRLLTARNNYFTGGGVIGSVSPISRVPGVSSKPIPTTLPIPDQLKKKTSTGSSIDWGSIGSTAISAAGGIGGSLISGGLQSGAGNVLSGLGSMASAIPGGQLIGAGLQLAGGLFNRAFGSQLNEENIAQVEDNIKALNNFQSNASDFDTLSQNWANADTAMAFSDSFIGKNGWFNSDATDKANELRAQQEIGTKHVQSALNNNAENIATTQMQNLLANYTAYGGPLYFAGGGDIASRHQGSTIDFENSKFARFFRSLFSSNKGKFSGGKTGGGGSRITPGEVTKYKEEKDTTIIPLPIVQTFNEAFAKARKGGDKTFQFNGKTYSTALGGGKGTYEAGQRRKAIVGIVPDTIIDTRLVPYTENTWALGGSLFADGGSIHIDPANRGKFTETKRRTGKTTEELTHSKNPITRKRAIFAQNAKKWKHSFGGDLTTHGANFDTGITLIGNGGTHEENPYEGVPMGVDQEGTPNLVEEGEVIFNDYVFSNRLKVPKAMRNKYKFLRGKKDLTFADAALQLAKESEERPNDPISQNGLEFLMADLANSQEEIRSKMQGNTFAKGGKLNKFPWGGHTLNPYAWVRGYNAGNWMVNGAYTDDYKRRVNAMQVADWQQHLKDQFDYWNNIANRGTDRYKAIDAMYKSNPWMKDYIVTNDDIATMAALAQENPGFMHPIQVLQRQLEAEVNNKSKKGKKEQFKIRQKGAEPIDFPEGETPWIGLRNGFKYGEDPDNPVNYKFITSETKDGVTTHYYDPIVKKDPGLSFFRDNANSPYSEGKLLSDALKSGIDLKLYGSPEEDENGNKYYTKLAPGKKMPIFDDPMRYAPLVGAMTGLGVSLFSTPDDGGAEAIRAAARRASRYNPVAFRPIGNYMTYNPFDLEFAAKQANAESAAARRAIMNTSGGNRAQAMAGILAANNNALNQLGTLRRGAAEDNLKQKQMVADFNRATNMFNSEGFFKADATNQQAMAQANGIMYNGAIAAEEARQRAKLARENAIQSNLSNMFASMGNIGQERVARQQMKWLFDNGYVPGYGSTNTAAKGGKIKRRKKGLTY